MRLFPLLRGRPKLFPYFSLTFRASLPSQLQVDFLTLYQTAYVVCTHMCVLHVFSIFLQSP